MIFFQDQNLSGIVDGDAAGWGHVELERRRIQIETFSIFAFHLNLVVTVQMKVSHFEIKVFGLKSYLFKQILTKILIHKIKI